MERYSTPQEEFWAGDFGNQYIGRNESAELLASNLSFFSKALSQTGKIFSCLEFGANIGMNLKAIKLLYPEATLKGIEINSIAAHILAQTIGAENVFEGSIYNYSSDNQVDLVLIKGVLIHIPPEKLDIVYDKHFTSTKKYILICEYYNPSPVTISYRGHTDRLFKRDFAGEMMSMHNNLRLIDYGFVYKRDIAFPQDDITWFLLEKSM